MLKTRLWNKSTITTTNQNGTETETTHLTYDVDNGWPAGGGNSATGR